jgi:hypothetical protein
MIGGMKPFMTHPARLCPLRRKRRTDAGGKGWSIWISTNSSGAAKRVYKKSSRQIAKETGHSRITIRRLLLVLEPRYRRNKKPVCAVMDAVGPVVERWLKDDLTAPRKQRHTSHRIYTRLLEEHEFKGAESTVRRWVREQKIRLGLKTTEAVVPRCHSPAVVFHQNIDIS